MPAISTLACMLSDRAGSNVSATIGIPIRSTRSAACAPNAAATVDEVATPSAKICQARMAIEQTTNTAR
jgi:hypothetical protein